VQQPPNQPYDLYIWEGKIDHFRINSSLVALWFGLVESPMMPRWTSQDVTGVKSWFFMWAMADCGGGIYYPIYRGSSWGNEDFWPWLTLIIYSIQSWHDRLRHINIPYWSDSPYIPVHLNISTLFLGENFVEIIESRGENRESATGYYTI
jgi:hypothetical protein